MIAYCYRSGQIGFGQRVPSGAIQILEGSGRHVRRVVEVTARHAYDGRTLLVPGLPEARTEAEAEAALRGYIAFVHRRRPSKAERPTVGRPRR